MLSECYKEKITPNYFSRYALIENIENPFSLPRTDINNDDIDIAISKVTGFWNKNKNNPKYTRTIEKFLSENSRAKEVLLNPETRAQRRITVEEDIRRRIQQKYTLLDEVLEQLTSEAYISLDQLNYLYKEFSRFPKEDIDKHLEEKKIHVKLVKGGDTQDLKSLYPMLEPSIMQDIRKELNVFEYNTLFEFLSIPQENYSIKEIKTKYLQLKEKWGTKPTNVEKTAADKLLSYVNTYLVEGNIADYVSGLKFESISEIDPLIKATFFHGVLEEDELTNLVSKAKNRGIKEEFARAYILNMAKKEDIVFLQSKNTNKLKCPECYFLNDRSSEHCKNCGEPLFRDCFKCGNKEIASNKACTKCGFALEETAKLKQHLKEYELFLRQKRFKEALGSLLEAKKLLVEDNEINQKMSNLEDKIEKLETAYRNYESVVFNKELYKAKNELDKLYDISPFYERNGKKLDEIKSILYAKIEDIDIKLQQASKLEIVNKSDEAIVIYEDILDTCRDCQTAKDRLVAIPPEPPSKLSISYKPGILSLKWKESLSVGKNLTYYVVRKENSKPMSSNDGTIIAKTKYVTALDTNGVIGHNYFYSVFTERGGVCSLKGTECLSVLFYDDIKNFALRQGDGIIEGFWDLPGNVEKVLIRRKEGTAPLSVRDGEEIAVQGLTRFTDRDVLNKHSYYYKVFCQFVDINGSTILSTGVYSCAKPNSPPPFLQNFTATKKQSNIIIKWKALESGFILFYKSELPPSFKEGDVLSKHELNKLGNPLPSYESSSAIDRRPETVCYYTPITFDNDFTVIGRTMRFTCLEDISKLKPEIFSSLIRLKWGWPEGCSQVMVSWRHDVLPSGPEDTQAKKEIISKAQYDLKGCFELEKPSKNKYLFRVFSMFYNKNEIIYSSGLGPEAEAEVKIPEGEIKYNIKRSFLGSRKVIIQSNNLIELPELVLVVKKGNVPPLTVHDGFELKKICNESIGPDKYHTVNLDKSKLQCPCYLKIFFSEDFNYSKYQIKHPGKREAYIK